MKAKFIIFLLLLLFVSTASATYIEANLQKRTATSIIAASDSVHKADADYFCDGTADNVQIQAAIDALPASGGTVLMLEGTYNIASTVLLQNLDNVTLKGVGWSTILKPTGDLHTIRIGEHENAANECSNVIITDFTIDGSNQSQMDLEEDCTVAHAGIIIESSPALIERLYVYNTGGDGIIAWDVPVGKYCVVRGCKVEGTRGSWGAIHAHGLTQQFIVINNVIIDSATMSIRHACIIAGNRIYNSTSESIMGTASGCTITGNYIEEAHDFGIRVYADKATVTGNVILSASGSDKYGIYASGNDYLVIANNYIEDFMRGMYIYNGEEATIANNVIVTTDYEAIALLNMDYSIVQGNIIEDCGSNNAAERAILIDNGTTDSLITNNTINCSGDKPNYGIYEDAGGDNDRNRIINNTIVGVNTDELFISGLSTEYFGNTGETHIPEVKLRTYKNTSGGALAAGDVVIADATGENYDGTQCITTTSQGDDKVLGMAVGTIADDASGKLLIEGKTAALKVDGTADIAIGDFLGTFTTAKIAMKAGVGDMAFAIALEAYATDDSAGVIDALLIEPVVQDSSNWDAAYTHSQDNSQAHSDYLINDGNDSTSGVLTAGGFVTAGTLVVDTDTLVVDAVNHRVGIGTSSPNSVFHIKANIPGTVGSHPAGQIIIQNPADSVVSNVVITAYESDGNGNPDQQLWYLGSASISNSDITFLNRRNAELNLGTNGVSRVTILGNGNVGIGETAPQDKLEVNGTALFKGAVKYTQDDGNEFISGAVADGYMDYGATTGHRFDNNVNVTGNVEVSGVVTPTTDVMYPVKTVVKTIDVDDDASTDDFQFDDDVADQVEQPIDLGEIIPAYAEVLSAQIRCFETVTGDAAMAIDLGTASGGAEVLATANTDSANDINGTGAGDGPEILAANAAKHIWINATPGANWNTLDAGRWAVMITYIDYGAVYTWKNP